MILDMTLDEYLHTNRIKDTRFAQLVGVSNATVGRWRKGEVPGSMETMRKIAEATDGAVMPNDFMLSE